MEAAVPSEAQTGAFVARQEAGEVVATAVPLAAQSPPDSGTASAWPSGSDRPPDLGSRAD